MPARTIPALLILAGLALLTVLYFGWSVRKPQPPDEIRDHRPQPVVKMTERFGEAVTVEKSLSPGETVVDSR